MLILLPRSFWTMFHCSRCSLCAILTVSSTQRQQYKQQGDVQRRFSIVSVVNFDQIFIYLEVTVLRLLRVEQWNTTRTLFWLSLFCCLYCWSNFQMFFNFVLTFDALFSYSSLITFKVISLMLINQWSPFTNG